MQRPAASTLRAVAYIQDEPAIKAVVAGHTHMNYEEVLRNGTIQVATAGNFGHFVREITVV